VGERVDLGALPKRDPDRLGVRMPHLLIWGMDDQALLPVSWATLPDHGDDLAIGKIAGADHWLVHQKTDEVTGLIDDFLPG
jgi:pimeloyl-ACP methyl ester carboxylesterase